MRQPRVRADFRFSAKTVAEILVAAGVLFLLLWFGVSSSEALAGQSSTATALSALAGQVETWVVILFVLGIGVWITTNVPGRRRRRSHWG